MRGSAAVTPLCHGCHRCDVKTKACAAGILILDEDASGRWHLILVQDRRTGEYSEPGGRFDSSDGDIAVTARRETLEETGIKLDAKRLMDLGVDDPGHSGYNRFYYRYECDSEDYWSTLSQARVDHENDELVWVSMDELDDMLERHEKSKLFNHVSYLFLRAFRSGEHPLE